MLIVGAGPTGLVLALWLTRLGVRVRIVDKTTEPGTTSRALAVQARTLELYGQIGLADAVIERGRRMIAANLWVAGKKAARAVFGDMGAGLSPELLGFEDAASRVLARLKRPDGTLETCEAAYIAGCDGAHSTVREALQIGFPGGVYAHLFYVADVEASEATMNGELHVALDRTDFLVVFPLKGERRTRLIGTVHEDAAQQHENLSWNDVSKRVNRMDTHRREARELVLYLPRPPSGRRSFSQGWCVPARRRRAHTQPRGWARHEHRHRRRGEPRVETRRRPSRAG